jgi:DNA gyrase subunit A
VEETWVVMSEDGRLARFADNKAPRLSGREAPVKLLRTDSHQTLYLVGEDGQAAAMAVQTLPMVERIEDGIDFHKASPLKDSNQVVALFSTRAGGNGEDLCIVSITEQGMIKKSLLSDLKGPSSDVFQMVKVNEGDRLIDIQLVHDKSQYIVMTEKGMAIRFEGSEVRVMGLVAAGVNAIKLGKDDWVTGMTELAGKGELSWIASNGLAWRVGLDDFPVQGRYGQGVIGCRLEPGVRVIGICYGKKNHQYALHFQKAAANVFRMDEVTLTLRAGKGVELIKIGPGEKVTQLVQVKELIE